MKTFHVVEPHLDGITKYEPGDRREADENEVRHLLDLNVLSDNPPVKAEPPLANKAGPALRNKAV